MLIVGLLVGGAAGYFLGDLIVFSAERNQAAADKTALQQRVTQLEQQVATLQTGTGNSGTGAGTGTGTSGTGTAPTVGGVTPDPETATWSVYTNTQYHFSFKYPADYETREFTDPTQFEEQGLPADDDEVKFAVGIFKPGDAQFALLVRVYKTPDDDGVDHREIKLSRFANWLPSGIQTEPAGAGQIAKIGESVVTVNGTDGFELTATEGRGLEATPGGSTYTGYVFEDVFSSHYLVQQCDSDQTVQRNVVGCLALTTFTITR